MNPTVFFALVSIFLFPGNYSYGLSLGNVWKQPDEGYWCKGLGDKWNRMNDYYKGYVDVMINADIEFQTE